MLILLIFLSAGFMYSNMYVREKLKNPETAKRNVLINILISFIAIGNFFPLSIEGNYKEQMYRRRANFFLALFWLCFMLVFVVMILKSY